MVKKADRENKRASDVLTFFNIVFIIMAIVSIVNIFITQYIWEPDPEYLHYFHPRRTKTDIDPDRGTILDHNGKMLAMSTPVYDIYMDCYVQKETNDSDPKKGKENEEKWLAKARMLASRLPEALPDEGKDASYYTNLILNGRKNKRQYVSIVKGIDHGTLEELKKLPLFNEPSHRGGLIIEKKETRHYPYGDLANRVIGYVKHNKDTNSRHIGIEGKFDYILHGKKGAEWKKVTDKNAMISDVDSSIVAVEHGYDIRTTLDINIQEIADRALRTNIAADEDIIGGCAVVMEVESGAIRAMANLQKNKKGEFKEIFNIAAGHISEPGSVFKAVTLMTLLEDGKVKLSDMIPTNKGRMDDMPKIRQDMTIARYESREHTDRISILEGFALSSNYVFRRLVKDHYGENPENFIERLHSYNFGEAYDFILQERGSSTPRIPDPSSKSWTIYDLVAVSIGYSIHVTPLQIATFYNAIANDGKMMKPYIVESIEDDGTVIQEFKPTILNGAICSKATADTLTEAMKMVTLEGTASRLKDAKCVIAGKTGTARIYLTKEEGAKKGEPYISNDGKKKHQATFVGFFPADKPVYTIITSVYTGLMEHDVYGGSIPAMTFKNIADEIWANSPIWGSQLEESGEIPQMTEDFIATSKAADSPVPDVMGLGLRDALYAIENNGYRCSYSGTGHVTSQNPAPGSQHTKGKTITITLQ